MQSFSGTLIAAMSDVCHDLVWLKLLLIMFDIVSRKDTFPRLPVEIEEHYANEEREKQEPF